MSDLTDRYNTPLDPRNEALFQVWAEHSGRLGDLRDYDLRGAFRANAKEALNGHLPDAFKKPNHPTFSTESIYHGTDGAIGGKWTETPNGWVFQASPYNLQNMSPSDLQLYFQHVEPDARLILPGPQP